MQEVFEKIIEQLEEKHEQYINTYGIVGGNPSAFAVKECIDTVLEIAEQYNNGWIPCDDRLPDNDRYILLSFDNFSVPCVGRYEEDENGGAFYIGDEDETCISQYLFVNAWKPLPEPYKEGERHE